MEYDVSNIQLYGQQIGKTFHSFKCSILPCFAFPSPPQDPNASNSLIKTSPLHTKLFNIHINGLLRLFLHLNNPPFFMELKPTEFNSIITAEVNQVVPKHPLISTIITFYILLLLYFPTLSLQIIFSPVFISTGTILLSLLRLGAAQKIQKEVNSTQPLQHDQQEAHDSNDENNIGCRFGNDSDPFFVEWDVRAPLEIIYEAYEGEEEKDDNDEDQQNGDVLKEKVLMGIERYASLSLYYPESDTDSSASSDGDFAVIGDWDSPERMGFTWDEEDREGLIEIELDGKRCGEVCNVEEDNLIEIDIFPARS